MRSHRSVRANRNKAIRAAMKAERALFKDACYGSYNHDYNVGLGRINDNVTSYVDRHRGDFHSTTPYTKMFGSSKGAVNFDISWLWPSWSSTRVLFENRAHQLKGLTFPFGYSSASRERTLATAQRALFAKIRKEAPGWDILSDAVELPETLRSLRAAAHWVGNLMDDVKNRRIKKVMRRLKVSTTRRNIRRMHQILLYGNKHPVTVGDSMANLWMNYRYAVMPVVYSVQDAFKAFCTDCYKGSENYCFTSQVTIPYETFTETVTPYSRDPLSYNLHFSVLEKTSVRLKAYFNYSASLITRLNLNSWHGLAAAAWEKVKFSWVVDWFISVGEYLQNLNVPDLVPDCVINQTIKGITEENLFITDVKTYDGRVIRNISFNALSGKNKTFMFARSPVGLSIPDVEVNLPSTWFNTKRSIDSSCLLWQKIRSNLGGHHL